MPLTFRWHVTTSLRIGQPKILGLKFLGFCTKRKVRTSEVSENTELGMVVSQPGRTDLQPPRAKFTVRFHDSTPLD
jgi:hypothetical protein